MRTISRKQIVDAIKDKIGPRSYPLENRFRKYDALMERLSSFRLISGNDKESRVPMGKNLEALFMEHDLYGKIERQMHKKRRVKPKICTMGEDAELHEADLENIKNRVWNLSLLRFGGLGFSSGEVRDYTDIVSDAAAELILLRMDLSHAIMASRALGIEPLDSVMDMISKAECIDLVPYTNPLDPEWRIYVNRIQKHEQYTIVKELIGAIDPKNRYSITNEMYSSSIKEEVRRVIGYGNLQEDPKKPVQSGNNKKRKKKRKKKKKNGNGKDKEIRHVVEFSEEIKQAIRDEGFDPEEMGDAIIYSFNLMKRTKAIANTHFKKEYFKKNLRKAYPKEWKGAYNFLNKYDLIIFHGGSVKKGDVSFNLKPDNEIGQEIAKTIIAYMQNGS